MKKIQTAYRILLIIACISLLPIILVGQNCSKKKLATKEQRGEFDFRGQSVFVELANGDTTKLKIVLYSKQNYKIFVVAEQKLGNVDYQIFVPRKRFNRVVKEVSEKTMKIYKKDPDGFYLYNNEGNRIEVGEEVVQDTIWTRETADVEQLVYDSRTAEIPYWLATPNKTQLVTIKVFVDEADKKIIGCTGLYVGREYSNVYQFRR